MANPLSAETVRQVFKVCLDNPKLGSRAVAELANVGKTTVNNLRKKSAELGLEPGEIVFLSDETIILKFGLFTRKEQFIVPDWEEIRLYLDTPRVWGIKMNSLKNAWLYIYLNRHFPDYINGMALPKECMSIRTFGRRYNDYLWENGIIKLKHNPAADLNFGPGSMMEIDTIGDRYEIINPNGELQKVVLFTAVHKYSGYIYIEAMSSNLGIAWSTAIINAQYDAGGCCEVLRSDNDSAICNHGSRKKGTKSRLKPSVVYTLKEFGMTSDLCPVRSPQWKGKNESTNGFIEKNLFSAPKYQNAFPMRCSLEEFNILLKEETARLNAMPYSHYQLSRKLMFEKYEQKHLKPLPLLKPMPHYLSEGYVDKSGYVTYAKNHYYVGAKLIGKDILIENVMGTRLRLLKPHSLEEIASYELDHNTLPPAHYHKADKFRSSVEQSQLRDRAWFDSCFDELNPNCVHIKAAIAWIWDLLPKSPAVAARLCNKIYRLYEKNPGLVEPLNNACYAVVQKRNLSDFTTYLEAAYDVYCRSYQEELCVPMPEDKEENTSSNETASSGKDSKNNDNQEQTNDDVRGSEYYANLI